ncbi:MAG TPA: 4-hydroxy-tetrahydrodipicolinate reductase, partial [Flavobacteriaceae bacterium]|nr:4-hydroxy-tetrahydrodipicolinate reductase [Flavobacteriaceae bacterium]
MKIALLGYGRMGKAIEKIAVERGHQIVLKIAKKTDLIDLTTADVAIDFSIPETAFYNITSSINLGVPIVSGTTGWLDKYDEVVELCKEKKGAFIYASNFSLGVNIFFEINKKLAKLMANYT